MGKLVNSSSDRGASGFRSDNGEFWLCVGPNVSRAFLAAPAKGLDARSQCERCRFVGRPIFQAHFLHLCDQVVHELRLTADFRPQLTILAEQAATDVAAAA